jgi:hypothetical protein
MAVDVVAMTEQHELRRSRPGDRQAQAIAVRRGKVFQDSYTPEDWRTLQFAPFWVSLAVAGADQEVEESETAVLRDRMAAVSLGRRRHSDPLVQELFESIARDPLTVMEAFKADRRALLDGIADVAAVLNRGGTVEHATALKAELLMLGMDTAEATVGRRKGLLGRFRKGERVSDEERAALVAIQMALEGQLDALKAAMR